MPGIWWQLCERYGVRTMFSSPTAIRVLKKHDAAWLTKYDLSAFKWLFLAGEPLDEPTAEWINGNLGKPVIDNYWQTETGWPVLTLLPGLDLKPVKFGSPGLPNLGYRLRLINEVTGEDCGPNEKGVLTIVPPLPPGCLTTVWGNDERFLASYFSHFSELLYSSLDWAIRDTDGYYFILGRTDDVINVAGHRLGTREIEEAVAGYPGVAEAAVVGVADEIKGQVPVVFATLRTQERRPRCPSRGRRRHPEAAWRPAWARWRARRAPTSSTCCPRRVRASCCAAPWRRWRSTPIPVTCPRWTTRTRSGTSRARWIEDPTSGHDSLRCHIVGGRLAEASRRD